MLIIEHRKNTVAELKNVPEHHGVEIDIRSYGDRLILHHDPFCEGTDFEEWLEYYNHKFLILNTKEEGLEKGIKALIDKKGITNYFYLDLSFPFFIRLVKEGERKIAVRFSEYEPIETCLSMIGKVEWVWIDCFTRLPLTPDSYEALTGHFQLCIVSPELQGRNVEEIHDFKELLRPFSIDAVCTKRPDLWSGD